MGKDQEELHAKAKDPDALPDLSEAQQDLTSNWKWVQAYAGGKHSQKDLSKHIAELGSWSAEALKLMPKIAKRTDGDVVLECASALGMPLVKALKLARQAKEPIKADSVREQLRLKTPDELATLNDDPDLVHELRTKVLKGSLAAELPVLADVPVAILTKDHLIEWYVETVDPAIAAIHLANTDAKKLAPVLDKLAPQTKKAWGWLSAMHIGHKPGTAAGLQGLKENTKNDAALKELTALTKDFSLETDKLAAQKAEGKVDFAKELSGKDDAALLDAAARADGDTLGDKKKVGQRLKGESAGTVIQYLATLSDYSEANVKFAIQLLSEAKGATMEHGMSLVNLVMSEQLAAALTNDTTRKQFRGIVGRDVGIRTVFPGWRREYVHEYIVKDEALREWALDDETPKNLLWLAAGSAAGAKLGCQRVKSDYRKNKDWWKDLPADADKEDLRRFAIHSPDTAGVSYIKTTFLNDVQHSIDARENRVDGTSGTLYGGTLRDGTPMTELRPKALGRGADPTTVLERLADFDATERKHVLSQPEEIKALLEQTAGQELRTVELLQPTYAQLAKFPIKSRPELVDYTTIHGGSEQLVGAQHAKEFHRILGPVSPFIAFPAMKNPDKLALALDDNHALLDWIFAETDANTALALLSRDPARKAVAALMSKGRHAYSGLPAYDKLRKAGREGFDAIAKDIKDEDTRDEVSEYKDGTATLAEADNARADRIKHANSVGNLVANLEDILDAGGSSSEIIAVVQAATPQQQIDLLAGDHEKLVKRLRFNVKVGPQHVFAGVSITQLLSLPDGASWFLSFKMAPTTVLHFIENNSSATAALGKFVSSNHEVAKDWVERLPRGGALTAIERRTLDELAQNVTHDTLIQSLFTARFDVTLTANFSLDDTQKLWSVLKRLPHAQVDQQVIEKFKKVPMDGPVGLWDRHRDPDPNKPDPVHGNIELDTVRMVGNDSHYEREIWMTADEVKAYYKLDDNGLKKASDEKSKEAWLQQANGKYKVKMTSPKLFDATVLHEVGHSVDTLLGEQTELIFGPAEAGWKRYGFDEFEQFADEMGALDNAKGDDRKAIVKVWQQALRTDLPVSELVGQDHPAIATKSPLQDYVDIKEPFTHNKTDLTPHNGRIFLQTPTALASLNKKAYDAAPTDYSMTAPAEYFAECYVEYYCRYNGTKDTEDKKGGRLPAWIKKWFDEHIDNIRFAPDRVHKGMGDDNA